MLGYVESFRLPPELVKEEGIAYVPLVNTDRKVAEKHTRYGNARFFTAIRPERPENVLTYLIDTGSPYKSAMNAIMQTESSHPLMGSIHLRAAQALLEGTFDDSNFSSFL